MKTFKLTVTEDELKALIRFNAEALVGQGLAMGRYSTETSSRIHDLTKRLNRTTPEIETDPRLQETNPNLPRDEYVKIPKGW